MSLLRKIGEGVRSSVENTLGIHVSKASRHGQRDYADLQRSGHDFAVVFDVGANVGQSAKKFREAFPAAAIYSFEPVKTTFATLRANTQSMQNVHCFDVALGSKEGEETIYMAGQSVTNSLVKPENVYGTETVRVSTVDVFAKANGITRIDLLKIDTEGFDIEVLKGAHAMLSSGAVAFVLVEVGFHPSDERHVLFDNVRSLLIDAGFAVYGIYDQHLEWTGEKRLRFANACFINDRIARASRRPQA